MALPTVIADTSALVALLSPRDQWAQWARREAAELPVPYITCEAVISETSFLLRLSPELQTALLSLISKGAIRIDFTLSLHIEAISALMTKYADLPMSIADACLVQMSDLVDNPVIFTADSDFLLYRRRGGKSLRLIYPNT